MPGIGQAGPVAVHRPIRSEAQDPDARTETARQRPGPQLAPALGTRAQALSRPAGVVDVTTTGGDADRELADGTVGHRPPRLVDQPRRPGPQRQALLGDQPVRRGCLGRPPSAGGGRGGVGGPSTPLSDTCTSSSTASAPSPPTSTRSAPYRPQASTVSAMSSPARAALTTPERPSASRHSSPRADAPCHRSSSGT